MKPARPHALTPAGSGLTTCERTPHHPQAHLGRQRALREEVNELGVAASGAVAVVLWHAGSASGDEARSMHVRQGRPMRSGRCPAATWPSAPEPRRATVGGTAQRNGTNPPAACTLLQPHTMLQLSNTSAPHPTSFVAFPRIHTVRTCILAMASCMLARPSALMPSPSLMRASVRASAALHSSRQLVVVVVGGLHSCLLKK